MYVLVAICFFFSGLSSLAYQIIWLRDLTRLLGAGPHAVGIMLAAFMGALGLGALIGGWLSVRLPRSALSLRAYGLIEIAIAIYALILPSLLAAARPTVSYLYDRLFPYPLVYHSVIFLLVAIVLLPPVAGMGATLPLLSRWFLSGRPHFGARLGFLYGFNTLGAASGTLLCGLVLLPSIGLKASLLAAAATNFVVGALAFLMGLRDGGMQAVAKTAVSGRIISERPMSRTIRSSFHARQAWAALVVVAISGYCAMAYEVIWVRLLGLVLGPTTYSFTLVLTLFIMGLALGAWVFGSLAERVVGASSGWPLVFTQAMAALLSLAAAHKMGNSQALVGKVALVYGGEFWPALLAKALFLILVLGGPVLLLGAAFPLAAQLVLNSGRVEGSAVGRTYAANTLGGVLGAWSAGFLLIPAFGKETSLSFLAALQVFGALGLALALRQPSEPAAGRRTAWGALAVLFIGTFSTAIFLPKWDRAALARIAGFRPDPSLAETSWVGAFLQSEAPKDPLDTSQEVFHGDGIGGFTSVWRRENALGGSQFTLYNSGKADASSDLDRFTQVVLAHFPLAMHPDPSKVMVLGLASGMTAGETLRYPIDSLDILEINEQVVAASRFFSPWNNRVLSQERTRLVLQDAKAHLLLTPRKYDVIISEPSNPWMAGLAELFTEEFYRSAHARLSQDGIMVQFVHTYQMDWPTFALMGRTFAEVFPSSMLVRTMPDERVAGQASDYLLVGFKSGKMPRIPAGPPRWEAPGQDRAIVRLEDARQLYRLVVAENLAEMFGQGPLHTDDRPRLEYAAARLMHTFDSRPIEEALRSRGRVSPEISAIADSLRRDPDAQLDYASFAFSLERPFSGMVDTVLMSAEQRRRFSNLVQDYCANHEVLDYQFLEGPNRWNCAAAQMAVLNRRLENGATGGEAAAVHLAMGMVCRGNGLPAKAMEYFGLAIRDAGETSPWARAAFREMSVILKVLGREEESVQAYLRSLK